MLKLTHVKILTDEGIQLSGRCIIPQPKIPISPHNKTVLVSPRVVRLLDRTLTPACVSPLKSICPGPGPISQLCPSQPSIIAAAYQTCNKVILCLAGNWGQMSFCDGTFSWRYRLAHLVSFSPSFGREDELVTFEGPWIIGPSMLTREGCNDDY